MPKTGSLLLATQRLVPRSRAMFGPYRLGPCTVGSGPLQRSSLLPLVVGDKGDSSRPVQPEHFNRRNLVLQASRLPGFQPWPRLLASRLATPPAALGADLVDHGRFGSSDMAHFAGRQ